MHIFTIQKKIFLGLPLPKGRPYILVLVRSNMDSVKIKSENLMDNFEAGKEGEREKEREQCTDHTPYERLV